MFDGEAFFRHSRSGITRYFTELISEFKNNSALQVEPITPYWIVANRHLAESMPGSYQRVMLPARWRAPLFTIANARSAARASTSVDLIHHSLYVPAALDYAPDIPRVCTVYDFIPELFPDLSPDTATNLADKELFLNRCDGLLCISKATNDDLKRFKPDLDVPVEITPLGVSENFFAGRMPRLKGIPSQYILHVGNRQAHKNIGVLLDAFAQLVRQHEDLHLVLCGNSLPSERERIDALGIADRTVHVRVSDGQLASLYAHADAFVFPSRYEGFGLPVIEAMASGCPVIMTEVPALLEIAPDSALTFGFEDVDTLIQHVTRVIEDRALRTRMIESGRTRARDYSWERTAETTSKAYGRILSHA